MGIVDWTDRLVKPIDTSEGMDGVSYSGIRAELMRSGWRMGSSVMGDGVV